MHAPFRRRYQLLTLLAALILLTLSVVPASSARAQTGPDWYNWNLKVDFPNNTLRALLVTYEGVGGKTTPAAVTSSSGPIDISSDCRTIGGLTIAGGQATFAGGGYIKCRINAALVPPDSCSNKMSPFYWAATRAKINAGSLSNPIVDLISPNGGSTFRFSLPVAAGRGRSQLIVPGASYISGQWDLGTVDNRVLMGANGPSIVSVADDFSAQSWLGFLTRPQWQNFMNSVPTNRIGNWSEPQMVGWKGSRIQESWLDTQWLYIGFSPTDGTFFNGTMWDVEVDPGCSVQ